MNDDYEAHVPCGTYSAYQRHVRLGELVDDDCREARNAYMRRYRKRRRRALRDRDRLINSARERAYREVARRHRAEFYEIFQEELKRRAVSIAHGELDDFAPS